MTQPRFAHVLTESERVLTNALSLRQNAARNGPPSWITGICRAPWRDKWNEIIFGHHTLAGRLFDLVLLILILLSVLTVLLESVTSIRQNHGTALRIAEWVFTALFTLEYLARLATASSAARYARSFFGIVDLP